MPVETILKLNYYGIDEGETKFPTNTERPSLPSGVCFATLPYRRFKVFSTSSSSSLVQELTTLKILFSLFIFVQTVSLHISTLLGINEIKNLSNLALFMFI
jgi:hypothetical protein